jgi:hypothetical protein
MKSGISRIALAALAFACALVSSACDTTGVGATTTAPGASGSPTVTPISIESKVLQYGKSQWTGNTSYSYDYTPTTTSGDFDGDGFSETMTQATYFYIADGAADVYSVIKYTDGGTVTGRLTNTSRKTSYSYTRAGNTITLKASSLYPYDQAYALSLSGSTVTFTGTGYVDYYDLDGDGNKTETCTTAFDYTIMSSMSLGDISF